MEKPIKSLRDVIRETKKIKRCWTTEGYLTLHVLIYCACLLEQLADKKKRPLSSYQKFVGKQMRAGKNLQEVADEWWRRHGK